MIPDSLESWRLEDIHGIVALGAFETDRFDLKEALPHPKDEDGKHRLRKSALAFANTDGGFLVFGIKDDRSLPPGDRIVGIDSSEDYPGRFASLVENLEPSVPWGFRNPPIPLPTSRVIHVMHVRASALRPHGLVRDDAWVFVKRTHGGNTRMSYEEIRSGFQNRRQRKNVLEALRSEVTRIEAKARETNIHGYHGPWKEAWLARYDPSVLDHLVKDALADIAEHPQLVQALGRLRMEVLEADRAVDALAAPRSEDQLMAAMTVIRSHAKRVMNAAAGGLRFLEQVNL